MNFDLPANQWSEDMILAKLKEVSQEIGKFPTQNTLRS